MTLTDGNKSELFDNKKAAMLTVPPRLDASSSMPFKVKITELVYKGYINLFIDLSKTMFIDSSGLGALANKISTFRKSSGDIILMFSHKGLWKCLR